MSVYHVLLSLWLSLDKKKHRRFALTRFLNLKTKKPIKSDHNLLYCTFKIKYESLKPTLRREVFKLKDTKGHEQFHSLTSINNGFSGLFSLNISFPQQTCLLIGKLRRILHRSFTKVRIVKVGKKRKKTLDVIQIMLEKRCEFEIFWILVLAKIYKRKQKLILGN